MWSSGMSMAASTSSATRCMRLVQISTMSAPDRSHRCAACASSLPARAQSSRTWQSRISAKSSDWSATLAEAWPPLRSATSSLTIR